VAPAAVVDQPQSGARYPVQWEVQTPVGTYTVNALLDAQELDSSASTGAVYWEGLSDLTHANGQAAGRGYLEMTGYTKAMRL
jgi:predicted secreted hydrolase